MLSSPKRKGHRNMARLSTVFPQQFHDMALERGIKSLHKSSEGRNTPAQPENQCTNILIT